MTGKAPDRRRRVLDDARRKVERALLISVAADELAAAAEIYLRTANDANRLRLTEAVTKYRTSTPE